MYKDYFIKLASVIASIFGFSITLWLAVSFVNWEWWHISLDEIFSTARVLFIMSIVYAGVWQYKDS